jgi:hypothetical protein
MSAERPTRTSLAFHCNKCSEIYEFLVSDDCPTEEDDDQRPDFGLCLDVLKEEGWIVFRTGDPRDEWGHLCSKCSEK